MAAIVGDLELGRGSLVREFHGEVIGCQYRRVGQDGVSLPSPFYVSV